MLTDGVLDGARSAMTQAVWDADGDVRKALRSITGDPQLGTPVLADPHVMANLLKDLLPDLPRESALLVAAAQCDLAGILSGHLAQGLDQVPAENAREIALGGRDQQRGLARQVGEQVLEQVGHDVRIG